MKAEGSSYLQGEQKLYVGDGKGFSTFVVAADGVMDVPELNSTHEEADTRMLLHLAFPGRVQDNLQKTVVWTPDTDVLLLLLHHKDALMCPEVYMFTGREGKHVSSRRFIPVHELYTAMSPQERESAC